MHRVQSLESGKESDVSIWKKRAEGAEKALVSKEREILDAKEVVSSFSFPVASGQLYCSTSVRPASCPACRPSTLRKR